jgi:hypothetical protein
MEDDLTLGNYIHKVPFSKSGHILRFWEAVNFIRPFPQLAPHGSPVKQALPDTFQMRKLRLRATWHMS